MKTDYRFGVIDSVNPQFGVVKVLLPNSAMRTVNECASVSLPREHVTHAEGNRNELFMNFSEKRTLEFVSDFPTKRRLWSIKVLILRNTLREILF